MSNNKRHIVVMTGTSDKSGGGITSVMRLLRKMPVWGKYNIYWLAMQEDGSVFHKLFFVIHSAIKSPFVIAKCKIVHFQMVPGVTLLTQLPALLSAKLFRKKVIMTVHVGNQLELYASDKFFKWWFKRADLILLLAKKWELLFKQKYGDVKVPTDVLYNACEIADPISMDVKKKIILFAGTLDRNKALDLLWQAWAKIKDKHDGWRIAVLGKGDMPHYVEMANELGLSDTVAFKGYLVGEEKERYFNEASILCLCSYMEGFPMTVLEAWSHSIAVVTTPVGGLPDVIDDEKNCLTIPIGDYHKLAEQLDRLISDEVLRKNVSCGGYECAKDNFSLDAINVKVDSIYTDFLNN